MKNNIITAVIGLTASLAALTPVASHAECRPDVVRMVRSLDGTTDKLVCEYRNSLQGRRICSAERSLMDACYALDRLTDDLRCSVERGDYRENQERILYSLKRTNASAQGLARDLRVCGCVKELLSCVNIVICQIDRAGFEPAYRAPVRHDYDRGHDHRREFSSHDSRDIRPSREQIIVNGLMGLLGAR